MRLVSFLQSETFADLTDYLIGPDGLLKQVKSFADGLPKDTALLAVTWRYRSYVCKGCIDQVV